ncbi:MAG: hypothetical protein ACW96U_00920 [Candidatus Heimdallarchaeaceae archaeon]|jgi:hypothetical protein
MGKTLGINDDAWHGIIPFVCMIAMGIVAGIVIEPGPIVSLVWLGLSLSLFAMQWINEYIQGKDPEVELKYGSWENFRKNSKKDWKFFMGGWFIGSFVYAIVYVIISKL